jgi:chromosomal replication initiation ATPase DnaA
MTHLDDHRLVDIFRREFEATRQLEAAVRAVATEVLASVPEQLPLPLPPVLVSSTPADEVEQRALVRAALELVASGAGITVGELTERSKRPHQVRARWVAMAVLRRYLDLPLDRVAEALGLSDHTTVMHGLRCYDAAPELVERGHAVMLALEGIDTETAVSVQDAGAATEAA